MMTRPGLCYHVPLHPLAMLESAEIYDIELNIQQVLAVFFHDAIYLPRNPVPMNEELSANLMVSCAPNGGADNFIREMILKTSKYAETLIPGLSEKEAQIVDLDLIHFAWPMDMFLAADVAVGKELELIFGKEEYSTGRREFFRMFVDRGFVYRSTRFRNDPNLEPCAMRNVRKIIDSAS